MSTSWQSIANGPKVHVLTWFGTFLVVEPTREWIEHRPSAAPATDPRLVYVEDRRGQPTWTSTLSRRVTRPRVLPAFEIDSLGKDRYSFKCVSNASSPGVGVGNFMCAALNGDMEINRPYVSDWEMFFLLDDARLEVLSNLLLGSGTSGTSGLQGPFRLEAGFILKGENGEYPLESVLV